MQDCPICLETFTKDNMQVLDCNHQLCTECFGIVRAQRAAGVSHQLCPYRCDATAHTNTEFIAVHDERSQFNHSVAHETQRLAVCVSIFVLLGVIGLLFVLLLREAGGGPAAPNTTPDGGTFRRM